MVTHKPEDLEYMNEVIFMAEGGHIAYYGDTNKYKEYFKEKTAVAVFAQLTEKNVLDQKYLNPRPLSSTITQSSNFKSKGSISSASKFFWLTEGI